MLNNNYYNNADSFGDFFDSQWKSLNSVDSQKGTQEKKDLVLSYIKDHPFYRDNPKLAKDIIDFRIRLLGFN